MSNLITLPFKTTQVIPLKDAVKNYIQSQHSETHPNAFRSDINKWESLRKDAMTNVIHTSSVDKLVAYQAQLTFISTKLPPDIDLPIPYSCPFPPSPNPPMLTMSNLIYEKINVLYNLAALYCNLAVSENRSNGEGIKRSLAYFQNASGVLSHIVSVIPSLIESLPPNTPLPIGLSAAFHNALQCLMLAQAQESFWQAAVLDNKVTVTLISKLAAKTASYYGRTLEAMEDLQTASAFSRDWIIHVRTKQCHFVAAALYRKSIDDLGGNRYGEEIARLEIAKSEAKKGLDAARRGSVAKAVIGDIKSLFNTVEASLKRAERDNDLIYHQVVPSSTSLPAIPDMKDVVSATVPSGLSEPKLVVGEGDAILAELSGWGVLKAIDIYNTRKNDWLQSEIFQPAKDLDVAAQTTLQALNLPASLDALDKPVGLPPSLLSKAEHVRREGGMIRVSKLLDNIKALDGQNRVALDKALDILDQEASEDEEMRAAYKGDVWTRSPSYKANKHLTDAANRYRDILDDIENTRRELQSTGNSWSKNIEALCWDNETLESAVPSSTGVTNGGSKLTQAHARALRSFLETLEDIIQERAALIGKAQRVSNTDDISDKFKREETSLARYAEVRPEAFDEAIERALGKYDGYKGELEENERQQNEALDEIKEKNILFLESRRECPSVKARESVLQDLDLAYHKYCTLCKDLIEGIKLHNDLSTLIAELENTCKTWVLERRKDIQWLTASLNATTLSASAEGHAAAGSITPNKATSIVRQYSDLSFDIPPPNSSAWDTLSPNETPQTRNSEFLKTPPMTKKDLNRPSPQPKDRAIHNDFAFDLPPPNSSAWESISPISPMLSPPGFPQTKTRKMPR